MTLEQCTTTESLCNYVEGLVNDFQGVEMQSDIDDETRKMYSDVMDFGLHLAKLSGAKIRADLEQFKDITQKCNDLSNLIEAEAELNGIIDDLPIM